MERICKNCGWKLEPEFKFCPNCGQEHKEKVVHFKQFMLDFLGDYFTFDSLIIRSVRPLLFNPGFLTQEFLAGRRVRYIPPLRMFIFISIIFFLVLGPVDSSVGVEKSDENEFLDFFFSVWFPRLFFLLLPLFAFFLFLMFRKSVKIYLSHFIFSVHFHAFIFALSTIFVILIDYIFPTSVFLSQWAFFITIGILEIYLLIALRKVYQQRWFITFFKLFLINIMYSISAMIIFAGVGTLIFLM